MALNPTNELVEQMQDFIRSASNVTDLLPILQHLPLFALKSFINQQIEQQTAAAQKIIYFNSSSIHDILPSDAMQHILSFGDFYRQKAVSKQWKLLAEQNENIKMNNLYQSVPQTESGSTFIIHPKRTHLNSVEIARGFIGPMPIHKALSVCRDGDRLLLHEANHFSSYDRMPLVIDKSIQIIGIGKGAVFNCDNSCDFYHQSLFNVEAVNVSFENITIDGSCSNQEVRSYGRVIDIGFELNEVSGTCRFNHCSFKSLPTTVIRINPLSVGKVSINDCKFEDVSCGIWVDTAANLNVAKCIFDQCGHSHLGVPRFFPIMLEREDASTLNCIENVFIDSKTHPVVEMTSSRSTEHVVDEDMHKYVLTGNVIKGNNQCNGETFEANKVYSNFVF